MTDYCIHVVSPERQDPPEPPERCENDALDGTDYCHEHLEQHDHALWESRDDVG